jgi:hypothetical protein
MMKEGFPCHTDRKCGKMNLLGTLIKNEERGTSFGTLKNPQSREHGNGTLY